MPFNKTVTRSLVELIGLSPRCQQFADYWFSAWDDNKLPAPEQFSLGKIRKLQPFILVLACKPDGSAIVTAIDLLPVMPPFMGRVCSGYAPQWGVLQTPSV